MVNVAVLALVFMAEIGRRWNDADLMGLNVHPDRPMKRVGTLSLVYLHYQSIQPESRFLYLSVDAILILGNNKKSTRESALINKYG
ncbi:hypothetical protein C7B61_12010 [filamentous cyanobacterium CCP1]|nr:hypothetical protein C7B76_16640 [filamentous cyanobacterium CCP2]PSB64637.1 hypothetical protein C7B61_12010 [filamentous cyanobacterium CCP1]